MEKSKTQDDPSSKIISATCTTKKRYPSGSGDISRRSVFPSIANNSALISPCHKITTHPVDSMPSQNSFRKKRVSMGVSTTLPRFPQHDETKRLDSNTNDMESLLLYNEYLQAIMKDHIIKQKAEERKNIIITQLITIAKESDHDSTELVKHRKRVKDIINLTIIQNALDPIVAEVNKYTRDETNKIMMDILTRLYSVVKPFDVLQCDNIILPETPEEKQELQNALEKCSATLKLIVDLIGSKGEVYAPVHDGLNDFIRVHNSILTLQKRLEGLLCNLQSLALKDVATALM